MSEPRSDIASPNRSLIVVAWRLRVCRIYDGKRIRGLFVKSRDVESICSNSRMVGPALDRLFDPAPGCGQVPHVRISERNLRCLRRTPSVGSLRNQLVGKRFAQSPYVAE